MPYNAVIRQTAAGASTSKATSVVASSGGPSSRFVAASALTASGAARPASANPIAAATARHLIRPTGSADGNAAANAGAVSWRGSTIQSKRLSGGPGKPNA